MIRTTLGGFSQSSFVYAQLARMKTNMEFKSRRSSEVPLWRKISVM